ncbi:MAG: L,D-transpeptidase [Gemmatimonadetes bacterium]|nr:L,D-transpeptidase [Gemmatimonadota bacterium]
MERPTTELARLDALLLDAGILAGDIRARAVQARAAVRSIDLRPTFLRDYGAARDSLMAVTGSLEPLASEADARSRRRLAERESVGDELRELSLLLDGVTLGADLRRALFETRARHTEAERLLDAGRVSDAAALLDSVSVALTAVRIEAHGLVARYADESSVRRWNGWVAEAVAESRTSGNVTMVVDKDLRRLSLFRSGILLSEHRVDLGSNASGVKLHQGDRATPEGRYRVLERKDLGASRYGRALLLDYPNPEDRDRLRRAIDAGTVRRGTSPGGLIEIHGAGGRNEDWTDGCVALPDTEMAEVFDRAPLGTLVVIVGGDGSGPWATAARRLARGR